MALSSAIVMPLKRQYLLRNDRERLPGSVRSLIVDPIGRLGISPEEIVLGQNLHHSVATEEQRQRLNDRCLVTVVGANKHGMPAEPDVTGPDAAKVLDAQIGNLHGVHLPPPYGTAYSFVSHSTRTGRRR